MSFGTRTVMRPWLFAFVTLLCLANVFPIRVYASSPRQAQGEPEISARAAIVVEYPSGRILYSKSMHDRLAPASTTKIVTTILALEHGNLDELVTVAPEDLVGESSMGLEAGEQQSMLNLIYGMLLPSGNDAAMAVARHLGSLAPASTGAPKDPVARFADLMNARTEQLGLQDSHFLTPHGLDADGHYSSAYDLASFTWYAFQFPVFNEIVKQQYYQAPGHPLRNTNEMLSRYPGTDGVKTGWTDAGGLCLVSSATRDGHRLISVVLNAPQWYKDSAAILDYGFAKLAAQPQDAAAEILSVAKRGTAAWLMANATSTPPLPTPVAMAQGGGVGASAPQLAPGDSSTSAPAALLNGDAPAPRPAGGGGDGRPLGMISLSDGKGLHLPVGLLLGIIMLALGCFVVWWMFGRRIGGFASRLAAAGPSVERVRAAQSETIDRAAFTPDRPRPATAPRTLGTAPPTRRREPNLLLTAEEIARGHVERAVSLAAQGKQGSSMAEFLLALRCGEPLVVDEIDSSYELDSTGFMALSRAQSAAGRLNDARITLEYGVAALPGDRLLRLAHRQMSVH